jgi:hypothetical protein
MSVLYLPSVQFDFVNVDEYNVLLAHPNLYNENSFYSSLKEIFFHYFPREEPLVVRDITWAIDSYLFGFKNPIGYHLGNVLINGLNVALLFVFLALTTKRLIYSLLITLTFGVLTVHVEPVCWIMGRKDLLATFFMIVTLIAQTLYLDAENRKERRQLYLFTILTTTAAMLSKINALSFFLVLAAHHLFRSYLDGSCSPDTPIDIKRLATKIAPRILPHFLITLIIFFWYKQIIGSFGLLDRGVENFSIDHIKYVAMFIPVILTIYLKLIFFPFQYTIFYQWPNITDPITLYDVIFSLSVAVVLGFITVILYQRRKDLFFYLASFLFLMIPYFNIIYIGIWVANRYVYFSSFCILAVVIGLAMDIVRNRKRFSKVLVFCIWFCFIALNVFRTLEHQQTWRNTHAVWSYENRLKNPSLLSFASLAASFIDLAQIETDPRSKENFLTEANHTLRKGLSRFGQPGLESPAPQLYRLFYLRASLASAMGKGLEIQSRYLKKAHELNPRDQQVNRMLAEIYYRVAAEKTDPCEKKGFAESSLNYFNAYVDLSYRDRIIQKNNMSILINSYEKNFPFLKEQIEPIKVKILKKTK